MRHNKEDDPSSSVPQAVDIISAVKELHGLSSQDLNKLLKDSDVFAISYVTEKGSVLKIDAEKLVNFLPLHLIALLMSSDRDEPLFRYLLCGLRLLHSFCELAPRHPKLEQILLDDVKTSEQLLDLVFYLLIVCSRVEQRYHDFVTLPLLHSSIVACSLHLLAGFISSQWPDLVHVLLAHPKVDIFMDAAFGAVCAAVKFLKIKLSAQHAGLFTNSSVYPEQVVNYLCQQCEASLQFLQSLCQQKLFRDRLLRNKDLCEKGGILFVAQAILKLDASQHFKESPRVMAAVSRLKAKLLSVLLNLCEADNISYLDEVASSPRTRELAKSVVSEVVELLRIEFGRDPRQSTSSDRNYPVGFLQLNALRLSDVFSDDSNFRSYVTSYFTRLLTAIFSLPSGDFISSWCSSILPVKEEEGSIEYDSFASAGWALDAFSSLNIQNPTSLELTIASNSLPQASYAHQRTSLFVKVIANLHVFIPNICKEQERNRFLNKFMEYLQMDPSNTLPGFSFTSNAPKSAIVGKNMRSLSTHAESLIPHVLNQEDLQIFRVFFNQLQAVLDSPEYEENRAQERKYEESMSWDKFAKLNLTDQNQEAQSAPPLLRKEYHNLDEMSENNPSFQDLQKKYLNNEHVPQVGDKVIEEKRKSSRNAFGGTLEIDKDAQNVETSGSDSSTRGKNRVIHTDNNEFPQSSMPIKESGSFGGNTFEEKQIETVQRDEKQRKKRKRTIMNEEQVELMERAIIDEPDMQRNAASLQTWADRLSRHGSEVTSAQLKNWLNNRKARLARTGKDVRAAPDADNSLADKQGGPVFRSIASPESPSENALIQPIAGRDPQTTTWRNSAATETLSEAAPTEAAINPSSENASQFTPGQSVVLVDVAGEVVAKGNVFQWQGMWYGQNLEDEKKCVVDTYELQGKRVSIPPHQSAAAGASVEKSETENGTNRLLWEAHRVLPSHSN